MRARLHQCRGGTGADRSVLLSSSSTLKAARAYLSWRASVPFWLGQENSDSQTGKPYLEYTSFKYLHSGSAQPAGVSRWRCRLKIRSMTGYCMQPHASNAAGHPLHALYA